MVLGANVTIPAKKKASLSKGFSLLFYDIQN